MPPACFRSSSGFAPFGRPMARKFFSMLRPPSFASIFTPATRFRDNCSGSFPPYSARSSSTPSSTAISQSRVNAKRMGPVVPSVSPPAAPIIVSHDANAKLIGAGTPRSVVAISLGLSSFTSGSDILDLANGGIVLPSDTSLSVYGATRGGCQYGARTPDTTRSWRFRTPHFLATSPVYPPTFYRSLRCSGSRTRDLIGISRNPTLSSVVQLSLQLPFPTAMWDHSRLAPSTFYSENCKRRTLEVGG